MPEIIPLIFAPLSMYSEGCLCIEHETHAKEAGHEDDKGKVCASGRSY